jgi:hypothetical protein
MPHRPGQRGYFTTEILIGVALATGLLLGVLAKGQRANDAARAAHIADQAIAVRDAVESVYAGLPDRTGLAADWRVLATALPRDMVVRANGAVAEYRNGSGGAVSLTGDNQVAFDIVGDADRRWCREIVARALPAFAAAEVQSVGAGSALAATASPAAIDAACTQGTGSYRLAFQLR